MPSFLDLPVEIRLSIIALLQQGPPALSKTCKTCTTLRAEVKPLLFKYVDLYRPQKSLPVFAYQVFTDPQVATAVHSIACPSVYLQDPIPDQTLSEWAHSNRSGWPRAPNTSQILRTVVRDATESPVEHDAVYKAIRDGSRLDLIATLALRHLPNLCSLPMGTWGCDNDLLLLRPLFRRWAQTSPFPLFGVTFHQHYTVPRTKTADSPSYGLLPDVFALQGLWQLDIIEVAPLVLNINEEATDIAPLSAIDTLCPQLEHLHITALCIVETARLDNVFLHAPNLLSLVVLSCGATSVDVDSGWAELFSIPHFERMLKTVQHHLEYLELQEAPFGFCETSQRRVSKVDLSYMRRLRTLILGPDWIWDKGTAQAVAECNSLTEGAAAHRHRLVNMIPSSLEYLEIQGIDVEIFYPLAVAHSALLVLLERYHHKRFPKLHSIGIKYDVTETAAICDIFLPCLTVATELDIQIGLAQTEPCRARREFMARQKYGDEWPAVVLRTVVPWYPEYFTRKAWDAGFKLLPHPGRVNWPVNSERAAASPR